MNSIMKNYKKMEKLEVQVSTANQSATESIQQISILKSGNFAIMEKFEKLKQIISKNASDQEKNVKIIEFFV